MIKSGGINVGIAGGVELLSDFPIRYNRKVDIFYFIFTLFY